MTALRNALICTILASAGMSSSVICACDAQFKLLIRIFVQVNKEAEC